MPFSQTKSPLPTALYLRLSAEEFESGEKLKNQENLLKNYLKARPELTLFKVYRDNGFSGTSFCRPAWSELIRDLHNGQIRCIVVKDLSRLGRNYIETGDYLETVFPLHGVRFISVNDSYDSAAPSGPFEPMVLWLKNLANDAYARDISKKIVTAKKIQRDAGNYCGNLAPYGYLRDPDCPRRLVVNPQTAPTVQRIFSWKAEGLSNTEIANALNRQGISSPMKYLYELGLVTHERWKHSSWQRSTVKTILQNRTYTGDLAQGKKRQNLSANQKTAKKLPPGQWTIREHTHEAIVSRELFFQVQELCDRELERNRRRRGSHGDSADPEDLFRGLVYSRQTGTPMYRARYWSKTGEMRYRYRVAAGRSPDGSPFPAVSVQEEKLKSSAAVALKKLAEVFLEPEELKGDRQALVPGQTPPPRQSPHSGARPWQETARSLALASLYRDYADGRLSPEQFQAEKARCRGQRREPEPVWDASPKAISPHPQTRQEPQDPHSGAPEPEPAISPLRHFLETGELNRRLATLLIAKIQVSSPKEIEICFSFRNEFPPSVPTEKGGDRPWNRDESSLHI